MKKILIASLFLIAAAISAQDKIVEGVKVPIKGMADGNQLVLNGAGVREKYFMDMYVCGLYLRALTADAEKICSVDEPSAIRIHIVSSLVSTSKMQSAVEEGFQKSTANNTAPLKTEIAAFVKAFSDPITKGDVFELTYSPSVGTTVIKNGNKKANIQGLAFKKAMFGIWLGNQPAQEDLKQAMLGK